MIACIRLHRSAAAQDCVICGALEKVLEGLADLSQAIVRAQTASDAIVIRDQLDQIGLNLRTVSTLAQATAEELTRRAMLRRESR